MKYKTKYGVGDHANGIGAKLLLIMISLNIFIFMPNTLSVVNGQQESIEMPIVNNGVEIGLLRIWTSELDGYTYEITIEYRFDKNVISGLVGRENPRIYVILTINYTVNEISQYIESQINEYSGILLISKFIEAKHLRHVYIRNINLDYIFVGETSISGSIDITGMMKERGMSTDLLIELDAYRISMISNLIDPGWIRYLIYSGGRYIGRLDIVASQIFSNTTDIRFDIEIINENFLRLMNTSILVDGYLVDGLIPMAVEFNITPGEDLVLPKMLGVGRQEMVIENIQFIVRMFDYIKIYNITRDIGQVNIHTPKIPSPLPIEFRLVSSRSLGDGWVEIVVGTNSPIDIESLSINYFSKSGRSPLAVRAFVAENLESYNYLIVIYICFPERGSYRGELVFSDGSRIGRLAIDVTVDEPASNVNIIPIEEHYTVVDLETFYIIEIDRLKRLIRTGLAQGEEITRYQEMITYLEARLGRPENKYTYVLFVPVNRSMGFTEYILLKVKFSIDVWDVSKQVIIKVDPMYSDIRAFYSETIFSTLVNGSSTGYIQFRDWSRRVDGEILFNLYNPTLSKDVETYLLGFKIQFINVKAMNFSVYDIYLVSISPPEASMYIYQVEIGGGVPIDLGIITNFIMPIAVLIGLLSLSIILISRRRG